MNRKYAEVLELLSNMLDDPASNPQQISDTLVRMYNTTLDPNVKSTIKAIWDIEQQTVEKLKNDDNERAHGNDGKNQTNQT